MASEAWGRATETELIREAQKARERRLKHLCGNTTSLSYGWHYA